MFHTSARHMLAASGLALSLALPATAQQTLSAEEEAIKQAVEADFDAQLVFLEKIVNINSDTRNPEGVREVGKVFDTEFKDLGFTTSWIDMPAEMERGGHFVATHEGTPGKKALLIGHIDTVFPTTSPFQKFEREGGRATGPGIVDMKAGDAIILYALKALKAPAIWNKAATRCFSPATRNRPANRLMSPAMT